MWIRLSEISPAGLPVTVETPLEQLGLDHEEWTAAGPATVRLRVTRDDDLIMVDGEISARLQFECSRCLSSSLYPMTVPVHITLSPAGSGKSEGVYQLQAGDLEQLLYHDDGIEMNDVVREQLLLALPMQVLCRPDCRGLCPSCGQNLNERACQCTTTVETPLAAQLKRFLK